MCKVFNIKTGTYIGDVMNGVIVVALILGKHIFTTSIDRARVVSEAEAYRLIRNDHDLAFVRL